MPDSFSAGTAQISEIFSSVQGEGSRMGERHLFIRFAGCDIGCAYCDENGKRAQAMSLADVLRETDRLEQNEGPHTCVSLTGGEPLQQLGFLKTLLPPLRSRGFCVLLETNGIRWQAFREISEACDVISVDIKLPSVGQHKDFFDNHRRFLETLRGREFYIKIVISKDADPAEFDRAVTMIAETAPAATVFIQPVWQERAESQAVLAEIFETAQCRLRDVRLGIQIHKMLNMN